MGEEQFARRDARGRSERQDTRGGDDDVAREARAVCGGDFAPLNAKTIARIERGEVDAPHGDTLARIAKRLGVKAEEIGSF